MRHLFLINGTDYVWSLSDEHAKNTFLIDTGVEAEEVVSIPDDKLVYIQEPAKGGEAIWWFELHEGWKLIETSTVGDFFKEYCGDKDIIAYSTEW
ncbi:hypothetical protein QO009_000442 [Brevibacillus aydinogluensis]|jgi:hypothetical protein|uniref:hypothetical protein n=1 Tax=Brevibacillus aydinogluensis TaxID=927786 RepID=UPI002892CC75|nr:hypothetical protein [Brevibacillus aydinogluensis]MDT3414598.1 hypothetical protein [Brevibacillus aydinogluensis]